MSRGRRTAKRKPLFHRRTAPGASPGSLVVDPHAPRPVVRLMAYDGEHCTERELRGKLDFDALRQCLEKYPVTWISVEGLGDVDVVRRLGETLGLHKLALEDVMNNHQRSKVEQYGDHLFIVGRTLEADQPESNQLSMFLGRRFVVTFQHSASACLDPVRERIRGGRGIIRSVGPDYLAYAVLDCVVDSYFPILEAISEQIETLEDLIIDGARDHMVARIHRIKTRLLAMRRVLWPLREALHVLVRDPISVIQESTRVYLRDCADHTFQIIDLVETYRELTGDLLELYHSSLSNRTNEVMQMLTVIATIFIPLTFIVGVYGMNFDEMPELRWRFGYPMVWAVMLAVACGLLAYFRQKGWLPGAATAKAPPEAEHP